MEQEKEPTPSYIQGFNEGYILKQHEPELSSQIKKIEHHSERLQGIKAGIEEYTTEKNRSYYPSFLKRRMEPTKDDRSPDKDDRSPDKDPGDRDK